MSRILVIGDTHAPCTHPGYLPFCRDLYDKYDCNKVVHIGDVVDNHAISFHAHHPDMPGPKDEYELALHEVAKWYKVFPRATVTIGNHDERIVRLAESVDIPPKFVRDYQDVWQTPKWHWTTDIVIDDVYYFHGTGNGGIHPAYNAMGKMLMSVVMGHIHTASGLKWKFNPTRRIFGMDVGTGIDERSLAFAYGRHMKQRSAVSAGVVLDGTPYHEIVPIGPGEKYNRSRFVKKSRKRSKK
ncbi:hypothetical protein LCGC14_0911890 [marine sediment metagenome]|uniref:Calcineurin-like phosphoesterase domain-containing protein n=1 Tax=marine sediment metagenome TaxID=412755 RepID=A0A0F9S066_9ZZZZ